jgi:hypothetical protein
LRTELADHRIDYDGSQLRSGWLRSERGLLLDEGGAVAAFIGACDVKSEFVVDLDEVASGEPIRAALMLHFIAEWPAADIGRAVLRQRLLAVVVRDELARRRPGTIFVRRGDDIYEADRKLTVSVATTSPVSSLLHFAINVDPAGAPVPARGLAEYGIEPDDFARRVLAAYAAELESAAAAERKVRQVP